MDTDTMMFWCSQKGSQKADEYVRMIKDQLNMAVEQCIQAAGQEIEVSQQKLLLRVQSLLTVPHSTACITEELLVD